MKFTVLPVLVALIVGLSLQTTNIINVSAWNAGIEHAQPWRHRSSLSASATRAVASLVARLYAWRSLISPRLVAASLAVLAMQLGVLPAEGSALLIAPMMIGEVAAPTLKEVKAAIDESNRAFETFKTEVKTALEAGRQPDPVLLEKLNEAMDKSSAVNEQLIETRAIVDRLAAAGVSVPGKGVDEKALAVFNATLKATAAAAGRTHQPVGEAEFRSYNEAFEALLRKGDRRLTDVEVKALSVGQNAEGGYNVSPDMTGRIVTRLLETSPMRQYAAVQPISTDALEGSVDLEEAEFGWVSELGARGETGTPDVPKPWRIPVHEAYSEPRISQKLVEDAAVDIVGWLAKKTADRHSRGHNTAFVTGSGVGKPRGFASYTTAATADGSRAWGTPEHIATGSNGAFGTDPNGVNKLLDLIHALKDHFAAKGAFYMNRTTLGKSRQLTDASANGRFVFLPSFQAGMPDSLLGYPIRKLQDMATYSTTNALAIAFGDMEAYYQIVDRLGLTVLVDPYTSKPWVKYYTRTRVGGDVIDFEALKFLKFGTS